MTEKAKTAVKTPESKTKNPGSSIRKSSSPRTTSSPLDQILHLQKTIGNQAVQRLFNSGALQAKIKIRDSQGNWDTSDNTFTLGN